jgi:hypothetical protein
MLGQPLVHQHSQFGRTHRITYNTVHYPSNVSLKSSSAVDA